MLPLNISDSDALMANMMRKTHKSRIIRNRLHAIWLLYKGYKGVECADILDVCSNTITNYKRLYIEGGLERICASRYRKPVSQMAPYANAISDFIKETIPESIAEIRQFINDSFGIEKGLQQVRLFVRKLGFRHRKATPFPGGKNPEKLLEKQREFKEEILFPLLKKGAMGIVDILFIDTVHFVQGSFCRQIWSLGPLYRPTSHGRYRVNVIGGLDIASRQVLSMYNDSYIRAGTIAGYLQWLRNVHYLDLDKKLCIILDNARYQKCKWIQEEADNWNIDLVYLPAYSPHFNLIERLWKYMKKRLGREFFYCKESFRSAIENILEFVNTEDFSEQFESMFTLKFQEFEKSKILTR